MSAFEAAMSILAMNENCDPYKEEPNLWKYLKLKHSNIISTFTAEEVDRCKRRCVDLYLHRMPHKFEFYEVALDKGNYSELLLRTLRNELFILPYRYGGWHVYDKGDGDFTVRVPDLAKMYSSEFNLDLEGLIKYDDKIFQETGRRIVFAAGINIGKFKAILDNIDKFGDLSGVGNLVSEKLILTIANRLSPYMGKDTLTKLLDVCKFSINENTINNIIGYVEAGWNPETIVYVLTNSYEDCLQKAMKERVDITWHLDFLSKFNVRDYSLRYKIQVICNAATKLIKSGFDANLIPVDKLRGEYQLDAIIALIKKGVTDKEQIEALTVDNKDTFMNWVESKINKGIAKHENYLKKVGIPKIKVGFPPTLKDETMQEASEHFDKNNGDISWKGRY